MRNLQQTGECFSIAFMRIADANSVKLIHKVYCTTESLEVLLSKHITIIHILKGIEVIYHEYVRSRLALQH